MNLQLKIPPVIVGLLAGCTIWMITEFANLPAFEFSFPNWIERILLGIAVLIGITGVAQFVRSNTTVNPHTPEKTIGLVTSGMYRFSRNPMYLAILILLIVFGLKMGNVLAILTGASFFILYMNKFQIKPEEEVLLQKFGSDYADYKKKVRRWI